MSRPVSNKETTKEYRRTQRNGSVYVYNRTTKYDPVKRNTVLVRSVLLGVIPKGETEMVETRPKKPNGAAKVSTATRLHVGMMEILAHLGKASGIDEDLYAVTDKGTAQKIISLARYWAASDGGTLADFEIFQRGHPTVYRSGMSESTCHELFVQIGHDESLCQNYFKARAARLNKHESIAFDSSTISTWSNGQIDARFGHSKEGDDLPVVKYLVLYGCESEQPVAFAKEPGNIPDVSSVINAIGQLQFLHLDKPELVTDTGFFSEENVLALLRGHLRFLTAATNTVSWLKAVYADHMDEFSKFSSIVPGDPQFTHGFTQMISHTFTWTKKDKQGRPLEGQQESKAFRLYVHAYFSKQKYDADFYDLYQELLFLKTQMEAGEPEFTDSAKRKIKKYLKVSRAGGKIKATVDEEQFAAATKYFGIFVLLSNHEKDFVTALRKYRKRNDIEEFFGADKRKVDGRRTRVWHADTLRGRQLVQFVALGYLSFLNHRVKQLKETLGVENGDPKHDLKKNLKQELALKKWMDNKSLHQQLTWFDCIETTTFKTDLWSKRMTTPATARDVLYTQKLGMF